MSAAFWDKQLVLVTGKGGVGKTTLSAALGMAAQRAGRKVLIAEVAPDLHTTSPLMTHFGQAGFRSEVPLPLADGLDGIRLAPQIGHRLFLRAALRVKLVVDAAMRSAALTRFLMAAPTFPEVGILYHLVSLLRQDAYDHIIVDLPATGHALALATLPRTVNRVVPNGLIGDAIKEGLDCLTDAERCWAVLPTLPESMPVTETIELIGALGRADITVGAAVLNQLPGDPFEEAERKSLVRHLAERDGHLLGARELIRLDRALAAQTAFRTNIPGAVAKMELPVFEGHDREVIEAVAGRLGADDQEETA